MNNKIEKIMLVRLNSTLINEVKHPRSIRPPFTLKYMQALLLQEKYQVKLIDCAIQLVVLDKLVDLSLEWQPQLIVISGSVLEYELITQYAAQLKKHNQDILIIVIGQIVSAEAHSYYSIDFALKGEVEIEILNLIDKIKEGENIDVLKAQYEKQLLNSPITIEYLDKLPFPIYEPLEFDEYIFVYPLKIYKRLKWGHILSSRGCPYSCIFCSQMMRESYEKNIRLRSAKNIVDEIEIMISMGVNVIAFDDDNFTTLKEHVISTCQEIKRRKMNINWICHARVDNLTKELLVLMKQAGCILIRCGIESGSEKILKVLRKGEYSSWNKKAKEVFLEAKRLNILTDALFLIGNPTETVTDIQESIALCKQLAPDIIQVAFFTPYPGSLAYEEYKDLLTNVTISQMYHYKSPVVNLSRVDSKELEYWQRRFYRGFLANPFFIVKHIWQYSLFYLYNLKILLRLFKGAIY